MTQPVVTANPTLLSMVNALRKDTKVESEQRDELFQKIDASRNLAAWEISGLEKIETLLGAFASTRSLEATVKKLFAYDDEFVASSIIRLLQDESFRIARFIDLAAAAENKLGLQEYQIEHGMGDDKPATNVSFETNDGYKFDSHFAMRSCQRMANENIASGLNIIEFSDSFGECVPVDREIIHSYGSDWAPAAQSYLIKTDGSENGNCYSLDGNDDGIEPVYHLDLQANPDRISLKSEFY